MASIGATAKKQHPVGNVGWSVSIVVIRFGLGVRGGVVRGWGVFLLHARINLVAGEAAPPFLRI